MATIREKIYRALEDAGGPLTIEEIIERIEKRGGLDGRDLKHKKAKIRNAMSGYDVSDFERVGKEQYDLVYRILDGCYFRLAPTEEEIDEGIIKADGENLFIFCYRFFEEHRDEYPVIIRGSSGFELKSALAWGEDGGYRLSIGGLGDWYRENPFKPDDNIILFVEDSRNRVFHLNYQAKKDRDEPVIRMKNQEVQEIAYGAINRVSTKDIMDFYLARRVIALYNYKDPTPPEPISLILEDDDRIVKRDGLYVLASHYYPSPLERLDDLTSLLSSLGIDEEELEDMLLSEFEEDEEECEPLGDFDEELCKGCEYYEDCQEEAEWVEECDTLEDFEDEICRYCPEYQECKKNYDLMKKEGEKLPDNVISLEEYKKRKGKG